MNARSILIVLANAALSASALQSLLALAKSRMGITAIIQLNVKVNIAIIINAVLLIII